ncbi:hypothetical protein TUN199_11281 [Pyrenophora tritici-repentis]|nr:hypothetical protein A1F99_136640 [Pyrenophora tritici-repentis]KAI0570265.1 hypothetical protein Alg130_11296 [Pyrenophora tritici-repentis]KAI0604473.1 hypothetical protein TUN205_11280 [Pyrenophora tritici-repentis]KAI0616727.1 hypothetical protein TUN199_11281 [Pyrenophora tritici-repentis]KAI1523965.1 hypothetical protein PtrSN001A_011074 [Pyrenophora tritici-repentis]
MSNWMPPPSSTTGAASSRSASPSKSSEPKVRDNEDKLRYYDIHFCQRRALPAVLQAFVNELQADTVSSLDAVRSPNARHVVQRQRRAQRLSEQDGIDLLKGMLLFVEDDDQPMLAVKAKQNLDKRYLPPPTDPAWVKEYGALEGPQPDQLFGYRHWKDSDSAATAFSTQQEYGLLSRAVAPALHFPFMSAQWKSPKNNQTHFQARPQGARDGAVIVRYLHQFYADAGLVPTVKDTAHFSLTIDMESAHLFIHWEEFDQERPAYYMEPVMKTFLDNEQQVADLRYMMKNVLAYAMGSRLANLRNAVEATQTQQAARSLPPSRSSSLGLFQRDSTVNIPPPTPQSPGDEPSHPPQKRQRVVSRASSSNT